MISQKARYALKALLALARCGAGQSLQIADIAQSQAIPRKFLEQILIDLKNHGLVQSRRGKAGGYLLLRDPGAITFGEVLRIVDGPIAPLPCLSKIAYRPCGDCPDEAACAIRRVFAQVADATRAVLDRTSIADARAGATVLEDAAGQAAPAPCLAPGPSEAPAPSEAAPAPMSEAAPAPRRCLG